jgi:hypothetical protein
VGADTSLKDAQGFDVMIEAARGGHREVIEVLTRSGAKTGISRVLQVRNDNDDSAWTARLGSTQWNSTQLIRSPAEQSSNSSGRFSTIQDTVAKLDAGRDRGRAALLIFWQVQVPCIQLTYG